VQEILTKTDFEQIYKMLIKSLPGEKWQDKNTDEYLDMAMQDWQ
jgi:hypothetical protein